MLPKRGESSSQVRNPRPTCRPSTGLTANQVVDKLIEAVENLNIPKQDSGLATLTAFCDDHAAFNGKPLLMDESAECIEMLAKAE